MKLLKNICLLLISLMVSSSCVEEEQTSLSYQHEEEGLTTYQALRNSLQSPLCTGTRTLDTDGILVSTWNGYTAENIGFESSKSLWAVFSTCNDSVIVRTFQNLIRITDDSGVMVNEIITTLVPSPEYFASHPNPVWDNFRFYDCRSDFTGYEIYSSPEDGSVFATWYYYNGKRQYGTILYEDDPHYRLKSAFVERILRNVSFIQTRNRVTRVEYKEYEEVEEIEGENGEPIKIIWRHLIPIGNSMLDDDDPCSDYLTSAGGGKYDTNDYVQKDVVEVKGSTFAKDKVLKSYLIDSTFPEGGYGSSPCFAASLALLYYDKCLTPDSIWIDIDSPDYFYNIFDDYINPKDLEFLISKYFRCRNTSANSIWGIINNGKLCVTVSRTGDSQCIYKCMLIVGYTQERDLIYLDPVTGDIKCRPNDCLDEYTFVLDSIKI